MGLNRLWVLGLFQSFDGQWCCFGGCIGLEWGFEWVVDLGLVSKLICDLGC